MPVLQTNLELTRCPHCNVNRPLLSTITTADTVNHAKQNQRTWVFYQCGNCGGVVMACAHEFGIEAQEIYPEPKIVDDLIPDRAKEYLRQAIDCLHSPAGAVMLAASSVDSMLKEKGYKEGSLYKRIEKAAEDHLITQDMAIWAHEVRLDANDQRHVDKNAVLPSGDDAKRVIDFVTALAQIIFVLPKMVQRGIESAKK